MKPLVSKRKDVCLHLSFYFHTVNELKKLSKQNMLLANVVKNIEEENLLLKERPISSSGLI